MTDATTRRETGALTPKAVETRRRILDAAVEVLRTRGHAGFSIPRVADVAGVFPGNVTYYFPTRAALIVALVGHVLELVRDELGPRLATLGPIDEASATRFCDAVIDRALTPLSVALIPELWSMASRYPQVAEALKDVHVAGVDVLTRALGVDPDAPASQPLRATVRVLTTVANGLLAMHGHRDPDDPILVVTRATAVELLVPRIVATAREATPAS